MSRYEVWFSPRNGPSTRHTFDTAKKALSFINAADANEAELTIRDLETNERLDIQGLKGRAAEEDTARFHSEPQSK